MKYFNDILYLEDAENFLYALEDDVRRKILYNISKAQYIRDPVLFKKIEDEIWEFRTLYKKVHYRLLAFWDREEDVVIVCSHAFIKKTQKTPVSEITKARRLREKYFEDKKI